MKSPLWSMKLEASEFLLISSSLLSMWVKMSFAENTILVAIPDKKIIKQIE